MASHTVLPKNLDAAKREFIKILNRSDETIVLILWDDDIAEAASDLAKEITEANEGDMGFYRFVNYVVAPDPRSIIDVLKDLENRSGADLNNLEDSVIVSISPFHNVVSRVVAKDRFRRGPGSINTALIAAMTIG